MDLATLVELKRALDALREERRRLSEQTQETLIRARAAIEMNRKTVEAARRQRREVMAERPETGPLAGADAPLQDQTCMFMMSE